MDAHPPDGLSRRRLQDLLGRGTVHLERLQQLQTRGGRRSPHRPFGRRPPIGSLLEPFCRQEPCRQSRKAGRTGTRRKELPTALVPLRAGLGSVRTQATPRRRRTTWQRRGRPTRSTTLLRSWPMPFMLSWRCWQERSASTGPGCALNRRSNHACRDFWRLRGAFGTSLSCWTPGRRTVSSVRDWLRSWVCHRRVRPDRVRC